jgi:methyl-accepting chemotaxis protein
MNYSAFGVLAIKAIQELAQTTHQQESTIEKQQATIEKLQSDVEALKKGIGTSAATASQSSNISKDPGLLVARLN